MTSLYQAIASNIELHLAQDDLFGQQPNPSQVHLADANCVAMGCGPKSRVYI